MRTVVVIFAVAFFGDLVAMWTARRIAKRARVARMRQEAQSRAALKAWRLEAAEQASRAQTWVVWTKRQEILQRERERLASERARTAEHPAPADDRIPRGA